MFAYSDVLCESDISLGFDTFSIVITGSLLSSSWHIWGDQPRVSPIDGRRHGISYPGHQCPHSEVSAPITHVWHHATKWLCHQVCPDEWNHAILESISPLYCHDYLYSSPKALSRVPGIASTGHTQLLSAQCCRTTQQQPHSSPIAPPLCLAVHSWHCSHFVPFYTFRIHFQ